MEPPDTTRPIEVDMVFQPFLFGMSDADFDLILRGYLHEAERFVREKREQYEAEWLRQWRLPPDEPLIVDARPTSEAVMETVRLIVDVDCNPETFEVDPVALIASYIVYLLNAHYALTARVSTATQIYPPVGPPENG